MAGGAGDVIAAVDVWGGAALAWSCLWGIDSWRCHSSHSWGRIRGTAGRCTRNVAAAAVNKVNNCCRCLPCSGCAIPKETRGRSSLHASCCRGCAALLHLDACRLHLLHLAACCLRLLLLVLLGGELLAAVLPWLGACMPRGRSAVHAGPCSMSLPPPLAAWLLLQLPPWVAAAICMHCVGRPWARKPGHAAGGECGMLLLTQLPLVLPLHLLVTLLPGCRALGRRNLLPWKALEACGHAPIG